MNFVNLTPHEIVVETESKRHVFPSAGNCRVSFVQKQVDTIDGIGVFHNTYGEVQDLPESKPDTIYIVSAMVINALKVSGINRSDVVAPDTGTSAVRLNGQIVAVRGFVRY